METSRKKEEAGRRERSLDEAGPSLAKQRFEKRTRHGSNPRRVPKIKSTKSNRVHMANPRFLQGYSSQIAKCKLATAKEKDLRRLATLKHRVDKTELILQNMGVTEEVWEEWKRKRRQKIRAERGSPEARRNTAANQIEPISREETAKDRDDAEDNEDPEDVIVSDDSVSILIISSDEETELDEIQVLSRATYGSPEESKPIIKKEQDSDPEADSDTQKKANRKERLKKIEEELESKVDSLRHAKIERITKLKKAADALIRAERAALAKAENIRTQKRTLRQEEQALQFFTNKLQEARRASIGDDMDTNDEMVRAVGKTNVEEALANDTEGNDGRGASSRPTASSLIHQDRSDYRTDTEGLPVRLKKPVKKPVMKPEAGDESPQEK